MTQPVRSRNDGSDPPRGSTSSTLVLFQRAAGTKPRAPSISHNAPDGLSTRSASAITTRSCTRCTDDSVASVRVKRSHSSR